MSLPEYMLLKEYKENPPFADDEELYRRVRPDDWEEDAIELDAIAFPDMSVTRQLLGPPDAARWCGEEYLDWGVIFFKVSDIPPEIAFQGAVVYRMRAVYQPLRRNKPHTEVRVFESKWDNPGEEIHIGKLQMPGVPREAEQEWREIMRRRSSIRLRPGEISPESQNWQT